MQFEHEGVVHVRGVHAIGAVSRDEGERILGARLWVILVFRVLEGGLVAGQLLLELEELILVTVELDAPGPDKRCRHVDRIGKRLAREWRPLVNLAPEGNALLAWIGVPELARSLTQLLGRELVDIRAAVSQKRA